MPKQTVLIYFQAHQPRRLKRRPMLPSLFDDAHDKRSIQEVAENWYLPTNKLLARLIRENEQFRFSLSVSGVLLDQARRFCPKLLDSFSSLAWLARETGRIEFIGQPYYHSLTGLFREGNKEEFRAQIQAQEKLLQELFEIHPVTFANPALLYNNAMAGVVGELGYRSMLCEQPADASSQSADTLYHDPQRRMTLMARHGRLSSELAQPNKTAANRIAALRQALQNLTNDIVLLGFPYEPDVRGVEKMAEVRDFWSALPATLADLSELVECATPAEIAARMTDQKLPILDISEAETSSWAGAEHDASVWLGNRGQKELFSRYEELEDRIKTADDETLLSNWRHLGGIGHYAWMCSDQAVLHAGVGVAAGRYDDVAEAVMVYATVLTELGVEVRSKFPTFHVKKKLRRPRILLVTPEVTELPPGMGNLANFISVKGGGLADISAALVAELLRLGLDIHVALPKYERQMRDYAHVSQQDLDRMTSLFQSTEAIHLVPDYAFAHLQEVYQAGSPELPVRRAVAFQRNVITNVFDLAMPLHGKMLVHCNDWMTGLIPAAARARGLKSLFTVHNIFSGKRTLRALEADGIDVSRFHEKLYYEKHPDTVPNFWENDGVDFLLSGIHAADHVNTVSPTFLREIVNGYFPDLIPHQLRELLGTKYAQESASGILNAPKSTVDPRLTRGLQVNYDDTTAPEAKRVNKVAFQKEMGLIVNPEAPLFFWPHRLFDQKGPRLLADVALALIEQYRPDGLQIAVVGNGDAHWEKHFGGLSCASHGAIAYSHFDPLLSELGKAGADFILMPSLYEPCGLPQMEGMRFGTLPIVRATGGLKDSVQHLDVLHETGNGFVFNDFVPDALWWACTEAMKFYRCPLDLRNKTIRRVMHEGMENFNLEKTTLQYVKIYERLLGETLI